MGRWLVILLLIDWLLRLPCTNAGHKKIKVRRASVLEDAYAEFMKIPVSEMREIFRFEFVGEEAIDAGGVAREFFTVVSQALFNVDFGLFKYSDTDNITYRINPNSGIANEQHKSFFHFAGRFMGKALMDSQLCSANLALPL